MIFLDIEINLANDFLELENIKFILLRRYPSTDFQNKIDKYTSCK